MANQENRKKILLVTRPICPPWDEASKNFAYTLAKNIAGFDFSLLTNGALPEIPRHVNQKPIYTSCNFSNFQKLRLLKHLRKMKNDFDILHYVFTPTKQNTFLIKKFASSKKSKSIQTIATLREDLFSDEDIKKLIFGDIVITYSDYAKSKLESLGFKNVRKIFPGVDLKKFSPAPKSIRMMDEWKIEPDDFVITYPGEFTRLGITNDLVRTIIKNSKEAKENNIKFVFACRIKNSKDLKKRTEIEKKFRKEGVLENVVFTDTYHDVPTILNLSDIIIFPVRNMKGKFDIPLVVVEAMACGKPVILSDIPQLQEFSTESNSVTIAKGNMHQLTSMISRLFNDEKLRDRLGKHARKYAKENFDIQETAKEYQKIYNEI